MNIHENKNELIVHICNVIRYICRLLLPIEGQNKTRDPKSEKNLTSKLSDHRTYDHTDSTYNTEYKNDL